jgi:hypothetical protein
MKKVLVVTVALTLILSACAWAGMNTAAKVAVHVTGHASRSCAKNFPSITGCAGITTTDPGVSVDVFPVFFDLVEYQGFDYGLMWTGSTCTFTSCSPLTIFSNVVDNTLRFPGDGVSHAWTACQYSTVAIPSFGWIYSYAMVCVVPHPQAGGPNIGDCRGGTDGVICNFCAGTNGLIGDDPCLPTATEPSTWGGVKSMFK